jgi:hypothetical protein
MNRSLDFGASFYLNRSVPAGTRGLHPTGMSAVFGFEVHDGRCLADVIPGLIFLWRSRRLRAFWEYYSGSSHGWLSRRSNCSRIDEPGYGVSQTEKERPTSRVAKGTRDAGETSSKTVGCDAVSYHTLESSDDLD